MARWSDRLGKTLAALKAAEFPKNAICHHLGIGVPGVVKPDIGIAPHGRGIVVMLYDRSRQPGFTAGQFREYRKGIVKYGKAIESWNGEDGHDGISIVIDWKPPKGFLRSINNYDAMASPFPALSLATGFAAFDKAWTAALKNQGLV